MSDENLAEAYQEMLSKPGPLPRQTEGEPFLITASELRDRKTKRRRRQAEMADRPQAIRLLKIGLKAKAK
jgi:hypothetical protein